MPSLGITRRGYSVRLVPDAADKGAFGVSRDEIASILAVERRMRHDGAWKTMAGCNRLEPVRLCRGSLAVPFRLYVNRSDDPVPRRVSTIIRREIGAPQGAVIAISERDRFWIAEPGMIVALEIPKVLMGVNNGDVVILVHRSKRLI